MFLSFQDRGIPPEKQREDNKKKKKKKKKAECKKGRPRYALAVS
jgi:hypothetical protein